ncbi:hypothetical protein BDZ97DRAFT_1766373 [Flammula alnicola]|nr:hypothetical protein BDZ97DRAFT_1766373 [Flammula alnicola]
MSAPPGFKIVVVLYGETKLQKTLHLEDTTPVSKAKEDGMREILSKLFTQPGAPKIINQDRSRMHRLLPRRSAEQYHNSYLTPSPLMDALAHSSSELMKLQRTAAEALPISESITGTATGTTTTSKKGRKKKNGKQSAQPIASTSSRTGDFKDRITGMPVDMQGDLAILKYENTVLKKANDDLNEKIKALRKDNDDLNEKIKVLQKGNAA